MGQITDQELINKLINELLNQENRIRKIIMLSSAIMIVEFIAIFVLVASAFNAPG